jgi:hypothetical protein
MPEIIAKNKNYGTSRLLLIRLFQQTTSGSVLGVPRPPFPKTLSEFQSKFATEEACQEYLAACRWPTGEASALAMFPMSAPGFADGRYHPA